MEQGKHGEIARLTTQRVLDAAERIGHQVLPKVTELASTANRRFEISRRSRNIGTTIRQRFGEIRTDLSEKLPGQY